MPWPEIVFVKFLAVGGFSIFFRDWIMALSLPPDVIMIFILLIYIPLGMVMDVMAMTLLTLPIVFPIVVSLGFDPIWFGVIFVVNICCGLLSPPYGFALFIEKAALGNLPEQYGITIKEIMFSVIPYCLAHVLLIILLLLVPSLATWLPNLLIG